MAHGGEDYSYIDYIKHKFEQNGITGVRDYVNQKMNEWQNVILNTAVIGNTGTGKSTFINAMLGLTADDEGSAAVGVTETTMTITPYTHPSYPQNVMWDAPGLGTPTYNRDDYFERINVDMYDSFIFITADRFRDDDLWLAKELDATGKQIYFVRSKVGQDMENNKRSHPKSHTDTGMLNTIREDCERNLQTIGFRRGLTVYLIDSFEPEKYKFDSLCGKLIDDAPELKRETLILSMTVLTQSVILSKKKTLSERIPYLSLGSAIAGAIPVPILDSAIDIGILMREAKFYRIQFGLSDEQLGAYAQRSGVSMEQLVSLLNLKSRMSKDDLVSYLKTKGAAKLGLLVVMKVDRYILPIIGSVISGCASYGLTNWCLREVLDATVEDAIKISNHIISA